MSIEVKDYIVRAIYAKNDDVATWHAFAVPLPENIVEDTIIIDEMALFTILKEHVSKWASKNEAVRLFAPDTSVLLRNFEYPEDLKASGLKEYVQMEIGHSIHLPFEEPLFDVYDPDEGDNEAILFAAPSEEVFKMTNLLEDIDYVPEIVDVRALSNIRLLHNIGMLNAEQTYLIADWSINELSISIYSNGKVEFLRYQSINTDLAKWHFEVLEDGTVSYQYDGDIEDYRMIVMDQVLEIDRMMNFFKFSLHKGERSVDEIIIVGDNPILDKVADFLTDNITVPIIAIDDVLMAQHYPGFTQRHVALLGLTLKESE